MITGLSVTRRMTLPTKSLATQISSTTSSAGRHLSGKASISQIPVADDTPAPKLSAVDEPLPDRRELVGIQVEERVAMGHVVRQMGIHRTIGLPRPQHHIGIAEARLDAGAAAGRGQSPRTLRKAEIPAEEADDIEAVRPDWSSTRRIVRSSSAVEVGVELHQDFGRKRRALADGQPSGEAAPAHGRPCGRESIGGRLVEDAR